MDALARYADGVIMDSHVELEYYEKVYYGYQVEGRGAYTPEELEERFLTAIPAYEEAIGPLLPGEKTVSCLDLGCGSGNWLYFLRQKGYANARGVDLDPVQVELARSLGLSAEVDDVIATLQRPEPLGLISALDIIEHLDKNSAVRFLELIYARLKSGGMLVLKCPCADGFCGAHDLCNDLTHRWAPSSNLLSQLLRAVGFENVRVIDLSLPPYPTGAKRQLFFCLRRIARRLTTFWLRFLGVPPPRVWSTSQMAVAWKPI
jgi:SAM-dependent methyltransferase